MRVGIIGDKTRATAWEKHLRPLAAVREVVLTASLSDLQEADACILLDDTRENLRQMCDAIRLGLHTYLVSALPTDYEQLNKVYLLSEESDVRVQFSHWPTISPSTQWMKQQLPKPEFVKIVREHSHLSFTENRPQFTHQWKDEIAWVVKWMERSIHKMEAQFLLPDSRETGIQIFIKFENRASASIFLFNSGSENSHRRIVSGQNILLDCNVESQIVKKTSLKGDKRSSVETQKFDATKAAELSAMLFFKAIKLKKPAAFTAYDALQSASAIAKIENLLKASSFTSPSSSF